MMDDLEAFLDLSFEQIFRGSEEFDQNSAEKIIAECDAKFGACTFERALQSGLGVALGIEALADGLTRAHLYDYLDASTIAYLSSFTRASTNP